MPAPNPYSNSSKRIRQRLGAQNSSWMSRAACAGTKGDLWHHERGESVTQAIEVCRGCPVRRACLHYAVATNQDEGTWGGHSAHSRRELRRRWLRLVKAAS
jgi:WhiB family transcriptional regulator, redox-sensing transcriptional regulator